MLKKTITYNDYNNVERTEDFYFNLSKADVIEMNLMVTGGLIEKINKITQTQDMPELFKLFKELIVKSYGEKSLDGKHFRKSAELSEAFLQTEAYSVLLMELLTGENAAQKAADFVNGIIPKVD
jgi:hypothetical protein